MILLASASIIFIPAIEVRHLKRTAPAVAILAAWSSQESTRKSTELRQ
jgi:hypothetical protein